MNTHHFCRFLAKIAHGFAVYSLGLTGFEPLLTDFIRIGGNGGNMIGSMFSTGSTKSKNLHDLSLQYWPRGTETFVVVSIRLFANLGAPTYLVVAGKAKAG